MDDNKKKDSVIFYISHFAGYEYLDDQTLGRLFRLVMQFARGEEVEVPGDLRMAYNFITIQMAKDDEKYQRIIEKRRKAGGSHKGNQYTPQNGTSVPSVPSSEQNGTNGTNGTDNDNVNGNDNDVSNETDILEQLQVIALSGSQGDQPTLQISWKAIVDYFNAMTKGVFGYLRMPLGEKRRTGLRARIRKFGAESFSQVVAKAVASDFLQGQNKNGFKATFDWLILPANYEKVLSGNYDNHDRQHTNVSNGGGYARQVKENPIDTFNRVFGGGSDDELKQEAEVAIWTEVL